MRYSLVQLDLVLSRCRRIFYFLSLYTCIKSSCLIFCTRDLFLLLMCEAFSSLSFYIVDLLRTSKYFYLFVYLIFMVVLPLNTRHRVIVFLLSMADHHSYILRGCHGLHVRLLLFGIQ